jgi:hypothetical protein
MEAIMTEKRQKRKIDKLKNLDFLTDNEKNIFSKKISSMTNEEIILYYQIKEKILKFEKEKILERRTLLENKRKNRSRKRIDHAKFIFAGEILKSDMGKSLLQKISKDNEYSQDDADALSLLAAEYNLKLSFKVKEAPKEKNKKSSGASASDNT